MKVILTQDVRGQGKRGQMIEVSDGYARNFLLPRKLAQEATADNINTMRMKDMTVVVTAKGGGAGRLFGAVFFAVASLFAGIAVEGRGRGRDGDEQREGQELFHVQNLRLMLNPNTGRLAFMLGM